MVRDHTKDPSYVIDSGLRRVLFELLIAQHGDDALTERPMFAGRSEPKTTAPANYSQAIAAARSIAAAARGTFYDYARKARSDGYSWLDLADPLGVSKDSEDPALDAFELVAPEPYSWHDPRRVVWTCASCGKSINDRGPRNEHPDDEETGHADNCERHALEVAAWRKRNAWDDDE